MMGMPMEAVVAGLVAWGKTAAYESGIRYEGGPRHARYWSLMDLRRSASYREFFGDRAAYERAESFMGLLTYIASAYAGVGLVKELGDGVLFRAEGLRGLVEVISTMDGVARAWRVEGAAPSSPTLKFSCAVDFGECSEVRRGERSDYLGRPLDRVARLAAFRDDSDSSLLAVLGPSVDDHEVEVLTSDLPFLSCSGARLLPHELQKGGEAPVRYRRLRIDRPRFDAFVGYFHPVRTLLESAGR